MAARKPALKTAAWLPSRPNVALKLAIFNSGRPQIEVAATAEIHETRLSKIVRGRITATPRERQNLALVLCAPIEDLFPEPVVEPELDAEQRLLPMSVDLEAAK